MRLRVDHWWDAGFRRAVELGAREDGSARTTWRVSRAEVGDVWICRYSPNGKSRYCGTNSAEYDDWQIEGYALTCIVESCRFGVHVWDHAFDCPRGKGEGACKHAGVSCWQWTGAIPHLSATPSLHSPISMGGCSFHGYLTDGALSSVG